MLGHKSYYVSFTDDQMCYTQLYFMGAKSDTFGRYWEYEVWLDNQFSMQAWCLWSNYRSKYLSDEFKCHLYDHGTEQQLTTNDHLQVNSITEQLNCTLIEHMQTILHTSGLSKTLWGDTIVYCVWIKNHTVTKALDGATLYELVYKCKLNIQNIPV